MMRFADTTRFADTGAAWSLALLRLSGASLLAVTAMSAAAHAGDQAARSGRNANCTMVGNNPISGQDADGCLRVGGHVRVEARVMQGEASLGAGLPYTQPGDGVGAAGMRSDTERSGATTRLRMPGVHTGGFFGR